MTKTNQPTSTPESGENQVKKDNSTNHELYDNIVRNDYGMETNENVEAYKAYDKDFVNPGEFKEEEGDGEIDLHCCKFLGVFDPINGKWVEQEDSENESYMVYVGYRNKKNVEVQLHADYGGGEHLKPSFDFVKEIAKKHFLVNDYMNQAKLDKYLSAGTAHSSFEEVEKMIEHYNQKSSDTYNENYKYRDGQGWHKTMTLEDAKKLMEDLKISVEFPSGDVEERDIDIRRIKRVLYERGHEVTLGDCEILWANYSETLCSGWVELGTDDDVVFDKISMCIDDLNKS